MLGLKKGGMEEVVGMLSFPVKMYGDTCQGNVV